MTSGRRSAFVIYDEAEFEKLHEYLFRTKQDASHYIWSLILKDLSRIDTERESLENNKQSTMISFSPSQIPPRIIEDFNHVIRPYLNKATTEELKLFRDTCHMGHIYCKYLVLAEQNNIITPEDRKLRNISYEQAYRGVDIISHMRPVNGGK